MRVVLDDEAVRVDAVALKVPRQTVRVPSLQAGSQVRASVT